MKISELVQELLEVMKTSGDLEVFDSEDYAVEGAYAMVSTDEQVKEYDMPQVHVRLISVR